ncbi:MAG: cell wall-binding repeat-containing protein [Peptostreptococcus sp.]|uniref:cell wall-binding repeat-containing protein n=1 Tax=Peptostreptococcus sp. TaxID=1262 RepID=UPI002FCC87E8
MKKILTLILASTFAITGFTVGSSFAAEKGISETPLFVVSKDKPVDMLSAMPLVNKEKGDILYVSNNGLTKEENLKMKNSRKVILIGGENSLRNELFNDIKITKRLSGQNRFDTSLKIFEYYNDNYSTNQVNLVSGKSYADASIVASKDIPVLLIDNYSNLINNKIKSELDKYSLTKTIIGGESVINNEQKKFFEANRIAGKDRYETSKLFSGNNENGYIESDDVSFINNINDAHKSFIENKGFILKRYKINKGDIIFDLDQIASSHSNHQILESGKNLLTNTNTSKNLYKNLMLFINGVDSGKYKKTYQMYNIILPMKVYFEEYELELPYPVKSIDNSLYFNLNKDGKYQGTFKIKTTDVLAENILNEINNILEKEF